METFTGQIKGETYLKFRLPCIYAWFRDGECLYVGSSERGISRIFDKSHHVIGKIDTVRIGDLIKVCWLLGEVTRTDLLGAEFVTMTKLNPKYNGRGRKSLLSLETRQLLDVNL